MRKIIPIKTFGKWLREEAATTKTIQTESVGVAIAIGAKISQLNQQIMRDSTATKSERMISNELFWLAALTALSVVAIQKK